MEEVAEAGRSSGSPRPVFEVAQTFLNDLAHFVGVVYTAEPSCVQVFSGRLLSVDGTTTRRVQAQVSDTERALHGALRGGDVLDVGEGYGHFPNDRDAFAHTQAAVGDEINENKDTAA